MSGFFDINSSASLLAVFLVVVHVAILCILFAWLWSQSPKQRRKDGVSIQDRIKTKKIAAKHD